MKNNVQELQDVVRQIRNHLEYRKMLGMTMIAANTEHQAATPPVTAPGSCPTADETVSTPGTPVEISDLGSVRAELGDCTRCKLHKGRTHIVFGEGNPNAELVFVGEGPGYEEDQQGRPFVGAAGQLLTDIIVKGMKLRREDVYICNIVKCRPPENRNPEPDEVEACIAFVKKQIAAIRPKVIVTLGNVPTQNLLKTKQGITKMRGNWQNYEGIPVMPTFHPSYLLRSPGEKKLAWADVQKVMARLGIPVPAKESGARSQEPGEKR